MCRCPQNNACPSIEVCPVSVITKAGYGLLFADMDKTIYMYTNVMITDDMESHVRELFRAEISNSTII